MRAALAALALLQIAATGAGPAAEANHARTQRDVLLASNAGGDTCVVLDANVFAHAADRALDDLRLYASAGGRETEQPFVLTESSAAASPQEQAVVQNLGEQNGRVVFDLVMPSRPYSEIDLDLGLKDFVAVVNVSTADEHPVDLGTFTLFDLSAQHGARSTSLPLAEATFPRLHVAMRVMHPDGSAYPVAPSSLHGAEVPPSREAQTIYVPVSSTSDIRQEQQTSVARLQVDAHVPIERATVVLDEAFHGNFVRSVTVSDANDLHASQSEPAAGEISREILTVPGAPPIHAEQLSVPSELGVNLRERARIAVAIHNGNDRPLPIRSVQLEMRQRRLCFASQPGTTYTLRYGDAALHAPVYDYARLFNASSPAAQATLGPEQPNPHYAPRADTRPYTERHPELLWIALIGVVVVLGSTAIGSAKHQRRIR